MSSTLSHSASSCESLEKMEDTSRAFADTYRTLGAGCGLA
jgi:hypothetical protein